MSASGSNATAPSTGAGGNQWPPRRPSKRSKLRNGTFIIPSTGERSRRQFTLRNGASASNAASSSPSGTVPANYADYFDDDDESPSFCTAVGFGARVESTRRQLVDSFLRFRTWLDSPKGRGVVKCTVAYMIASLWTFWPPLSDLLGKLDGKHMVATITVYFHPARSAGSMIEACAIGVVAVAYASTISVLSMAASVFFGSVLGWVTFGYMVVLFFFIGVTFGFIGWVKQRLNNPSVNVGCTLASLAIITVVTKENNTYSSVFSNTKIVQILKILVFGIATTATVSLVLWRVSARALLRESMIKASTSLGDMLAMITHGFLSGAEDELTITGEFSAASGSWSNAYAQMTKNLKEAKYEHYAVGHASIYQLEKNVYKSMETLAQSIGGLRSAANTQFELLRESAAMTGGGGDSIQLQSPSTPSRPGMYRSSSSFQRSGRIGALSAIDEASDEGSDRQDTPLLLNLIDDTVENGENNGGNTAGDASNVATPTTMNGSQFSNLSRRSSMATLRTSSEIFELFISMLGPSMKSLAFTLAGVLRDPPFGSAQNNYAIHINEHYRQSLTDALVLFNTARAEALQELYRTIEFGRPRYSEKIKADFEEVAAACGHFSFSLQAFGEEMSKYLDVLDDLKLASDHNRRSWRWVLFWKQPQLRYPSVLPFNVPEPDAQVEAAVGDPAVGSSAWASATVRPIRKSQLPKGIPDHMVHRRDTFSWQAAPQANVLVMSFAQRLLKFFRVLTRDDIRFGIKVGIGAIMWASMAFIAQTRDTYMHWRGEWGLLSFMIVCSMTVGASNTTAIARFLATLTGSTWAVINWHISQGHAVPLMFLGLLISFCSFYVLIEMGKAPLGRTTLLAYNVITLYAYLLSQRVDDDDDDEGGLHPLILEIAKHRFLAVTAGICWGLIVCRLVWPISARSRFKEGVSVLYLQMGLIWKRGPLAILLRTDCSQSYLRSGEQAALQRYASRLETLRNGAASEFELRGPFPYAAAGRVLAATNRVLDGFYAMSLLTQRRGNLTPGERALLYYTAPERAMLCDRICHVFQVLASSYMLEYPLTDALPSVDNVRDRLLAKIFQFRKEHTLPNTTAETPNNGTTAAGTGSSATAATTPATPTAQGDLMTLAVQQLADSAGAPSVLSPDAGPSLAPVTPVTPVTPATPNVPVGLAQNYPSGALNGNGKPGTPGDSVVTAEEPDYALLYAYALVTGQVAEELKSIAKEFEGLFGVLDEDAMLLQ